MTAWHPLAPRLKYPYSGAARNTAIAFLDLCQIFFSNFYFRFTFTFSITIVDFFNTFIHGTFCFAGPLYDS